MGLCLIGYYLLKKKKKFVWKVMSGCPQTRLNTSG
jgi:hypothetical protein